MQSMYQCTKRLELTSKIHSSVQQAKSTGSSQRTARISCSGLPVVWTAERSKQGGSRNEVQTEEKEKKGPADNKKGSLLRGSLTLSTTTSLRGAFFTAKGGRRRNTQEGSLRQRLEGAGLC